MKVCTRTYNFLFISTLAVLVGVAGVAQAATLQCGRGALFFRAYDADDGAVTIKRELHFMIYRFTNPGTATATISEIKFFDPDGVLVKTLGAGGDPFPDEFDPVIAPKAQEDLELKDVFDTPDPPDKLFVRLFATSDKKLIGTRIRVARGFKPGFGGQEERSRVILDCKD